MKINLETLKKIISEEVEAAMAEEMPIGEEMFGGEEEAEEMGDHDELAEEHREELMEALRSMLEKMEEDPEYSPSADVIEAVMMEHEAEMGEEEGDLLPAEEVEEDDEDEEEEGDEDSDDEDDAEDEDEEEDEGLTEAKRRKKMSKKASKAKAKKAAKTKFKGIPKTAKGKRKAFDMEKAAAKKWAKDPEATAQAAVMSAFGEPVIAKGEHRKLGK